ncbi:MAG TPA: hypothetical protein VE710_01155 [Candidatus Bathyarchaeia archaeon]|nr:hypothetical protein [Candidatus Bathyarchaeia archaeon]
MTTMPVQEKIKRMEDEIKRLQKELDSMLKKNSQFERIDTDVYLTEVYNG